MIALAQAVLSGRISPSIFHVEEPESYLHASAHGAVGDLLIEASGHCPVVAETHSENLLLRIRRRIAEGDLSPDAVALYFINDSHEVSRIRIQEDGAVAAWPSGVFEYDVEESEAIVAARMDSIAGSAS